MEKVRALLIPAEEDTPAKVGLITNSWNALRGVLNAVTVQPVDIGGGVNIWVNEQGALERLPVNSRACSLVNSYIPGYTQFDYLQGAALVIGVDDEGEYFSVPDDVLQRFAAITGAAF